MLSKELEQTLNDAFRSARSRRHEFMTVEHLLLALLDNNDAIRVLKACGAEISNLRGDLVEFIDSTTPLIPEGDDERETQPTLGFQRVLQRAFFTSRAQARARSRRQCAGGDLLRAGIPGGLLPEEPERVAPRRGQLHHPRDLQGR
jgi:ATP-dependent Clp protease ATP-binding subunit ClpA